MACRRTRSRNSRFTRQRQNPILEKFYVKTLWESSFLRSFGYVPRIPTVFVRYRTEFTQLIEKDGHSIFNPRPWRWFDYAVLGTDPTCAIRGRSARAFGPGAYRWRDVFSRPVRCLQ